MNNWPKISIVTPNYNGGQYLEQTILSIINQCYPNLEYIVIDGGSTDNSIEIIKKYEDKIAYWISEPDNGLYNAIQKGFDRSSGEIMAWLNSDDMYHFNSLYTVAEIFSSFPMINWLQGNPTTFDETGRITNCSEVKQWSKYDFYLFNYKWVQQESVFWRRNLWEKVDGKIDASLKLAGDLDLWLRFFRYDKLYVTGALIGGFRQRASNQLSLDRMEEYIFEANTKIKEEKIIMGDDDKKIILFYNLLSRLSNYFDNIKVVNTSFILRWFEKKYFAYPDKVNFDRLTQKFFI